MPQEDYYRKQGMRISRFKSLAEKNEKKAVQLDEQRREHQAIHWRNNNQRHPAQQKRTFLAWSRTIERIIMSLITDYDRAKIVLLKCRNRGATWTDIALYPLGELYNMLETQRQAERQIPVDSEAGYVDKKDYGLGALPVYTPFT